MNRTSLQAGWSIVRLPVFDQAPLGGYAANRAADGVRDWLMAGALVFEQDGKRLIAVSLDLLAVDHLLYEQVSRQLQQQNITYDDLLLCCIHTHSAYAGLLDTTRGILGAARSFMLEPDPALIEAIAGCVVDAISQADSRLAPTALSISRFCVPGIASNRVDPQGWTPDECALLRLDTAASHALLCFFACHPTVLDAGSTLLSADWIGSARSALEKQGESDFFFFNGAAGDLSCRYTRRESSFEEADRLGSLFARAVLNHLYDTVPLATAPARMDCVSISLRLKAQLPLDLAEANYSRAVEREQDGLQEHLDALAQRTLRAEREGALAAMLYAQCDLEGDALQLDCPLLRLPALSVLFLPGEMFSSLQHDCLPDDLLVVSCTNDYVLYLADRAAHEAGSYEALSSPFESGQAEALMEAVVHQLNKS